MRTSLKLACLSIFAATSAFANPTTYTWPKTKIVYHHSPNEACLLEIVSAYQPGGEHQPIHLKVKNKTHNRLAYTMAISVDGKDAGTFNVDNIGAETNDRDSNMRFEGHVTGTTLKVEVTSCTVRKD